LSSSFEKIKAQYTFAIALVIIAAYVVFFAVVMYQSKATSFDDLKTITATFGIIVAAVVGYYFGQKPVESAEQRANAATGQAAQLKSQTDALKDEAAQLRSALNDESLRHSMLIRSDLEKERQRMETDSAMLNSINRISQNR
jgi:hypothetical protein